MMQYSILNKVFDINAADFVDMSYLQGNPAVTSHKEQ